MALNNSLAGTSDNIASLVDVTETWSKKEAVDTSKLSDNVVQEQKLDFVENNRFDHELDDSCGKYFDLHGNNSIKKRN